MDYKKVFEVSSLENSSRQKYKSRKINSQTNLVSNKTARSKSPENPVSMEKTKFPNINCKRFTYAEAGESAGTSKYFPNPAPSDVGEYKLIVKKNSPIKTDPSALSNAVKEFKCDLKPLLIVTSVSDDLERQALDEYQSSNESFYKELERQAEEQYEDSENSLSPPNEDLYFGGRPSLCEHFSVYFSDTLTTYFQVYIYHYA